MTADQREQALAALLPLTPDDTDLDEWEYVYNVKELRRITGLVRTALTQPVLSAEMATTILEAGLFENRLFKDEDEMTAAVSALRAVIGGAKP
jgi:hypothetical protein